jgi:AcrR family transcriptional regulator
LELGYEGTSTPHIVRAAGLTRGALYHHFDDKKALFAAVVEREADLVGATIASASEGVEDPTKSLIKGAEAYFDAMRVSGRAELLLLSAPSVLGHEHAATVTLGDGVEELKEGLQAAKPTLGERELSALADVLSAAFDRAALAIAGGADRDAYASAMRELLNR